MCNLHCRLRSMTLRIVRLAVRTGSALNVMRGTWNFGFWIRFDLNMNGFGGMVTKRTGGMSVRSQSIHMAHLARTRSSAKWTIEGMSDMRMRWTIGMTRTWSTHGVLTRWWSAWAATKRWWTTSWGSWPTTSRLLRRRFRCRWFVVFMLSSSILRCCHLFVSFFASNTLVM